MWDHVPLHALSLSGVGVGFAHGVTRHMQKPRACPQMKFATRMMCRIHGKKLSPTFPAPPSEEQLPSD
jgi:hypothetical protein